MSSEAVVQQQVRLLMAQLGAQLWRNNSGAYQDETGRHIRYGLCNDSAQLNANIKSSDLIGPVPVVIQPHHVGRTVGIFTALEIKPSGWTLRPSDKRACAQANFHTIVKNVGGFAGFVTDPQDVYGIIQL
mgnify:CR=1 FL=1